MNGGWSEDVRNALDDNGFSDIESMIYEVRNCIRGCYTNANTNTELADYIRGLAEGLQRAADEIESLPDEVEEE